MSVELKQKTPVIRDGVVTCPSCGRDGALLYAFDVSQYYQLQVRDGKLIGVRENRHHVDADNARIFCSQCGDYLQLPAEEIACR